MYEGIDYIVFVSVSICVMLAFGSIPVALREPPPRSSVAFGAAFALMALAWLLGLQRSGAVDQAAMIIGQNAVWCASLLFLCSGIWLRTGHQPDPVFLLLLLCIWMIPIAVFSAWIPNGALRTSAAGLSLALGVTSCAWRLWRKEGHKNAGDWLLMGMFVATLLLVMYGTTLGLRLGADRGATEVVLFYLSSVPIMLTGIGLFVYQSYALDAIDEKERQARTDTLTGLLNRRAFDEELTVALARAKRYGRPLALVMADIDHFKRINDNFGHPFGDRVLREFAQMLREESREVDIVARIGGEEFAVVVPEIDTAQAAVFAERLRQATESIVIRDAELRASYGVASTNDSDYSGSALIQDADAALYQAKQNGRNRVELSGVLGMASRGGSIPQPV